MYEGGEGNSGAGKGEGSRAHRRGPFYLWFASVCCEAV